MTFSKFQEIDTLPEADRQSFGLARAGKPQPTIYPGKDGKDVSLPTFEIGLVLAGAVSAGAYTAGVIDYFIEAMDSWERAKEADALQHGDDYAAWNVPPHAVRLRVIAGASAGSVCGAAFAVATRGSFPSGADLPVTLAAQSVRLSPEPGSGMKTGFAAHHPNPLYDLWVRQLDIRPMLDTADLDNLPPDGLVSLLNVAPLDHAAQSLVNLDLEPAPPRRWIDPGVQYGFTIANLTGVPYLYQLVGLEGGQFLTSRHADLMRFRVAGRNDIASEANSDCELHIDYAPAAEIRSEWQDMAAAALASGAFPGALGARRLVKPVAAYRFDIERKAHGERRPDPGWSQRTRISAGTVTTMLSGTELPILAVDGGTMNNEPFEFARQVLAGPLGSNPRDGHLATRAVILIDPFPARAVPDPSIPGVPQPKRGLLAVMTSLLGATIAQARYDSNDLVLATNSDIYSRFILSPMRGRQNMTTATGGAAIAGGSARAFGGFLSERYRHHDFMLGRRNAENFLRNYFALPDTNPLYRAGRRYWADKGTPKVPIGGAWTITGTEDGLHERLIIPIVAALGQQPAVGVKSDQARKQAVRDALISKSPVWPGDRAYVTALLAELRQPMRKRIEALAGLLMQPYLWYPLALVARWHVARLSIARVEALLRKELEAAGLDEPQP